jgi:DNA-binding MarR family transcriptional regulator
MREQLDVSTERFEAVLTGFWRRVAGELAQAPRNDLTFPQYFILQTMNESESIRVTKLAERMEVKPSAITVMIDRLVQRGYAVRRQDDSDRRVVLIAITDEGRQELEQAKQARKTVFRRFLSKLESEELEHFLAIFEKLMALPDESDPKNQDGKEFKLNGGETK